MVELAVRVVFSLAVVLGLLWLVARTSARRFGGPGRSLVRVHARQSLARTASLAVVEVGDRVLVVGVSEHGVNLLTEMDPAELPEPDPEVPAVGGTGLWSRRPSLGARAARTTGAADLPPGATGATGAGLTGSVLSTQTWKQAWAAATSRNGAGRD